jgi:hypothetical protein
MNNILKQLYSIPEVIGVCLSGKKIIKLQMIKNESNLEDFSELLPVFDSILTLSLNHFRDSSGFSVSYKESLLIMERIQKNLFLMVMCRYGIDKKYLRKTLDEIKEKFFLDADKNVPENLTAEAPSTEVKIDEKTMVAARNALVRAMGPMGGFIVDDIRNTVMEGDHAFSEKYLLDCIASETDDSDLFGKFSDYFKQEVK